MRGVTKALLPQTHVGKSILSRHAEERHMRSAVLYVLRMNLVGNTCVEANDMPFRCLPSVRSTSSPCESAEACMEDASVKKA